MKLIELPRIFLLIILCEMAALQLHAQVKKTHKQPQSTKIRQLPVDSAASIVVISYTSPPIMDPGIIDKNGKKILPPERPRYPGSIDTFGYKEVREILPISKGDIPKLKNILYTLQCGGQQIMTHACYDPRNSILLLDQKGAIIAELQICFECLGYETFPEGIEIYDMRPCKYDALKQFMINVGIKYGTIDGR